MLWLARDARSSLLSSAALIAFLYPLATAAMAELPDPPCSATSNRTHTFVNLQSLIRRKGFDQDYSTRHDNISFTLNICAPALSADDLHFPSAEDARNVSAYYRKGDKAYSLGRASLKPKFVGKKLVLDYAGGSLCPKLDAEGLPIEGEDNEAGYRRGLTLSFVCDRDLISPPTISFISQRYNCSYWFEVRTASACATVKAQSLGPVAIFSIISLVALMVYFVGGCFYQRTVLQARGWRQVPHWQTWLRALNFVWVRKILFPARWFSVRGGG
ncbi:Cation-independent mannose-6-phosphate receptor CI-MPR [Orbilia brochopaga]|uniref:Cation-independent mannose-6-phosphate receptor CI-MPR n=1 Tax=Orbilia brochopaga TaxID=3140254 RepID=A0AAV9UTI3_9PEZI